MDFIIKSQKGYIAYLQGKKIAYTSFRDNAQRFKLDTVTEVVNLIRSVDPTARKVVA